MIGEPLTIIRIINLISVASNRITWDSEYWWALGVTNQKSVIFWKNRDKYPVWYGKFIIYKKANRHFAIFSLN